MAYQPLTLMEALGRELQFHRKRQKIVQVDLAEACGKTRTWISKIETGKTGTSLATLRCITACLGIRLSSVILQAEEATREQP